jgi:hypothetical protein
MAYKQAVLVAIVYCDSLGQQSDETWWCSYGTGSVERRQAERTKQGERRPPAYLGLMFRRYITALKEKMRLLLLRRL